MNKHVLAAAWGAHNRQLAARFGRAMTKARAELGRGGNFTSIVRRAWALDPGLRDQFGDAVSAGLRAMWANPVARAAQSERIRRTYTPNLRKQRSVSLKENWADAAFREKMMHRRRQNDGR
jgi:hypothetical protein